MADEFEERIITPSSTQYTTGPKGLIFRDVATDEEFRVYADDLFKILEHSKFRVMAKVINGSSTYKALRVKEKAGGKQGNQPEG